MLIAFEMDTVSGFLAHEKFSMDAVKRYSHEDVSESIKKVVDLMIELAKNFDELRIAFEKLDKSENKDSPA